MSPLFAVATASAYMPTDSDLERAIQTHLATQPGIASPRVHVSVDNGLPTLTGTVDTVLAHHRALEVADRVVGVGRVDDQLEVHIPDVGDATLQSMVWHALSNDPVVEIAHVDVAVDDGIITLSGDVDSRTERWAARRTALGVPGVRWVDNDLVVVEGPRDDAEIIKDVRARLAWDLFLSDSGPAMSIEVADGHVALDGVVSGDFERERARGLALVDGVQSVDVSRLRKEAWAADPMVATPDDPGARWARSLSWRIADHIHHEAPELDALDVDVYDGSVRLSGHVDDREEANLALHLASEVSDRPVLDFLARNR